jgi:EAL domain-containing protein (putative c-di-GMP-specific phosphodiesterase class I)
MGCEYTQGFLLGRPQPEEALFELVDRHRAGDSDNNHGTPVTE